MSSNDAVDLYDYNPNKILPIVAGVLFLLGTLTSVLRTYKLRGWRFMLPWIIGGFFETIGYFVRYASVKKPTTDGGIAVYAVSSTLIVVAPALFAATLYMSYGRMIMKVDGGRHSLIRASLVTKIFVTFDILSFLTQAAGGAIFAQKNANSAKIGKDLMMAGLIIQIIAFVGFLLISIIYTSRVHNKPTFRRFRALLWLLWGVGILILVRSVFRTIEFGAGNQNGDTQTGYLLTHEVFFYTLETLPMILCVVLVDIFTPNYWLTEIRVSKEEEVELS